MFIQRFRIFARYDNLYRPCECLPRKSSCVPCKKAKGPEYVASVNTTTKNCFKTGLFSLNFLWIIKRSTYCHSEVAGSLVPESKPRGSRLKSRLETGLGIEIKAWKVSEWFSEPKPRYSQSRNRNQYFFSQSCFHIFCYFYCEKVLFLCKIVLIPSIVIEIPGFSFQD